MSTPTKKKLSVEQAAQQWLRARRDIKKHKALLEEAAEVLLAHFTKTGRKAYKDLVGLTTSTREILDQSKVRAFLGKKLPQFQKRSTSEYLIPLGDEGNAK